MTNTGINGLAQKLDAVCVFQDTLKTEPINALAGFLKAPGNAALYGAFVRALAEYDFCFSAFLKAAVQADENRYITAFAEGRTPNEAVRKNAANELKLFTALSRLQPEELTAQLGGCSDLPVFINEETDFTALYEARCKNVSKTGYGVFAGGNLFCWKNGAPAPVEAADTVLPEELIGYETERGAVEANLLRLLNGKPAANMLLYGEAGTGKSSTVKALVNRYAGEGLRLLELKKDALFCLPDVMARIRRDPLRFVIFIDDLSFTKNDDQFGALKSVLEGAAGAQAANAVIAATSNRRHIVKERFSDREAGDDVHFGDTVNELTSLADRFGLAVRFGKPDKKTYLAIVHALAARFGVAENAYTDTEAEAFALKKGSRSPRAAKQFVLSKM